MEGHEERALIGREVVVRYDQQLLVARHAMSAPEMCVMYAQGREERGGTRRSESLSLTSWSSPSDLREGKIGRRDRGKPGTTASPSKLSTLCRAELSSATNPASTTQPPTSESSNARSVRCRIRMVFPSSCVHFRSKIWSQQPPAQHRHRSRCAKETHEILQLRRATYEDALNRGVD